MSEYVGLDVSLEETSVCILDAAGSITFEGKVDSNPAAIEQLLKLRAPTAVKVGLETGPTSTWLWHELHAAGVPVICIDARHTQAALSMRINKTDRNDAQGLAQLMRMGWYREVKVKQLSAHVDSALLASRALIVSQRCDLENQIRGLMKNFGLRCKVTKGAGFERAVLLLVRHHQGLRDVLVPLLAARDALRKQEAALTAKVRERTLASPACRRLMTMPGVGSMTALAYSATIDDPTRFRHSESVGAYLGLTPRRYSSGETDRTGRISRCGDALARSYLYEAANVLLSRSTMTSSLKSWAQRIAKRSGAKKARVALARKMAVVLHRMWLDGTDFGAHTVNAA
jgi:transposase